ncbi:BRO family protein [Eubacterium multiforme]|uniref:Excisionase family DNA binding protein n=1 Tax=Eubacterium multiforme TaxID=83339 RepID=A0ABT9UY04_9FIRM|nr:BRO family protein [Eubacterium multiforme]MDQ0151181.1 excisionase family DNA binding protein [Eubacterium multiforme]
MRYYTVEETAKKLKVSTGHIYELVKRGEIKKKEGLGRAIRIPSGELKNVNIENNYFTYDKERVQAIETHLGKIRKLKDRDYYVIADLAKALGLNDSFVITRRLDKSEYMKLNTVQANDYGLSCNQRGLLIITYTGILLYSKKSRKRNTIDFNRLLEELKVSNCKQIEFEEAEHKRELQIFNNEEFGQVRVLNKEGEPWFVGKDVAERLGYLNSSKALTDHVDEEDKLNNVSLSSLGQRGGWLINESGLYSLILSSKLPNAKKFKRWITSEVLPTIRKTGGYVDNEEKFTDSYFSNLSLEVRQVIKQELLNRNKQIVNRKREIIEESKKLKKEYDMNNKAIEQLVI